MGTVSIALIDSGVNAVHSHVGWVAAGLALYEGRGGEVLRIYGDLEDRIGHGTAVAGVIRHKAPEADIYAVKIFHSELRAPVCLLAGALEWAVAHRIKVIHLSLGSTSEEGREAIEALCKEAFDRGLVVVGAARSHDDPVYPASLPWVIGVYWDRACGPDDLVYHEGGPIEFGACGLPRPLPGIAQERNFRGGSFAAARVTAMAARLLGGDPSAGVLWVRERLIEAAARQGRARPSSGSGNRSPGP